MACILIFEKMRKITIDTPGNATETGDMGLKLFTIGAAGDATRGLFAGGVNRSNYQSGPAVSVASIKYFSYATANSAYHEVFQGLYQTSHYIKRLCRKTGKY